MTTTCGLLTETMAGVMTNFSLTLRRSKRFSERTGQSQVCGRVFNGFKSRQPCSIKMLYCLSPNLCIGLFDCTQLPLYTGYRGTNGPISVEEPEVTPEVTKAFIEGGKEIGLEARDSNGEEQIGGEDVCYSLRNMKHNLTKPGHLEVYVSIFFSETAQVGLEAVPCPTL